MTREYRCQRGNYLLFKGSLELLLTKQHDLDANSIEPKCPKCGLINRFTYHAQDTIQKAQF